VVADDWVATTLIEAIDASSPDVKETRMTTLAEKWTAEGEARGRMQGKADMLRKLLALRFGELSKATEARIVAANEVDLDVWVERVMTAETLESVLGV
jgi:hypothetical protein